MVDHAVDLDHKAEGRVVEVNTSQTTRLVGYVELCLQFRKAGLAGEFAKLSLEIAVWLPFRWRSVDQQLTHGRDAAASTTSEHPQQVVELGVIREPVGKTQKSRARSTLAVLTRGKIEDRAGWACDGNRVQGRHLAGRQQNRLVHGCEVRRPRTRPPRRRVACPGHRLNPGRRHHAAAEVCDSTACSPTSRTAARARSAAVSGDPLAPENAGRWPR